MDKQKYRVCRDCRVPLIWTFLWAYNERYCINCGKNTPMMDGSPEEEADLSLTAQKEVIDSLWGALAKHLLPDSSYKMDGCEGCKTEDHPLHLKQDEVLRDEVATKALEKLKGFLIPNL